AKKLGSSYILGHRSDNWRKIINWSYHNVIVSKMNFGPLTVYLQNSSGKYLGSISIGLTKEIRKELLKRTPPFNCIVKARGWTTGNKLRLPQIIEVPPPR